MVWMLVLAPLVIAAIVLTVRDWNRQRRLDDLDAHIKETWAGLRTLLMQSYMVESCARCLEDQMELIEIAPSGRSVHYKCVHCGKRTRSPAGSPDAVESISLWDVLVELVEEYNCSSPTEVYELTMTFRTAAAPLPFEQTTRSPIPQAVRTEVWRRDGGRCVECGSNQNLQFDHIIPVSRGGATTAKNLQLLCQSCNSAKRAKI